SGCRENIFAAKTQSYFGRASLQKLSLQLARRTIHRDLRRRGIRFLKLFTSLSWEKAVADPRHLIADGCIGDTIHTDRHARRLARRDVNASSLREGLGLTQESHGQSRTSHPTDSFPTDSLQHRFPFFPASARCNVQPECKHCTVDASRI